MRLYYYPTTAFVQAVQASLPGTASFNDAVSIIIDTVAHFSMHPFPEVPLGRARLLGLFAQHGIPGVHINKVMEKIGIPKAQLGALSSPDLFAEHCSNDDAYKLADFFLYHPALRGRNSKYPLSGAGY